MFGGSNVDQGAQGHRPLALGWPTVSKVPKISELWFVYESTKKKRFEKSPNVCKWLSICFKYYSDIFNDHFKPTNKALALKTAEIQPFENLINFYWILNILNGKCHGHADRVGDADHVGHSSFFWERLLKSYNELVNNLKNW